jgi:nitrogen regulatory protein PII-like uncharacterized protein
MADAYVNAMLNETIGDKKMLIHFSETDLSDFYKDAHGFRPRNYKEWWTKEELEAEYNYLSKVCEDNMKREAIAEAEALVKFEKLVEETINHGAGDRETAIRWLVQGEGLELNISDLQYFFWGHGLSYEIQNEYAKLYSK